MIKIKSIVFLSNYYNHHQSSVARELNELCDDYVFVETGKISAERMKLGWGNEEKPEYVWIYNVYKNECDEKIRNADVVICGSAPDELIEKRLKSGKLTFKYSERFYKTGFPLKKYLRNAAAAWLHHGRFQKYPIYMLCASAYTSADCAKFGNYKNRCYKWGYFTELKYYDDIDKLLELKRPFSILWVARLIKLKHPELPIKIAKRLKSDGYSFDMNIIGIGAMEQELHNMITDNKLQEQVHLLGSMKPEQVREYMEQSQIYLFTSDRNEGWGAVLNESMNSACAVVASHEIGSVPFLLKDGENGLIYKDRDEEDLYRKVKLLLDKPDLCRQYGRKAYQTMADDWNAETAAKRFIELSEAILNGDKKPDLFTDGPCSKAYVLKDNWYKDN